MVRKTPFCQECGTFLAVGEPGLCNYCADRPVDLGAGPMTAAFLYPPYSGDKKAWLATRPGYAKPSHRADQFLRYRTL